MKVFLDEMPLGREPVTVSEALRAAAESAELVGRIVISVEADGRALSEGELTRLEEAKTAVSELRLISADPHALIRRVFQDAREALGTVASLQRVAADACATGDSATAMAQLAGVLETWKAVRDAVEKSGELLGFDLASVKFSFDGREVVATGLVAELARALDGLLSGVKGRDWSAVGDVLSYDLGPLAGSWGAMFVELDRRLGRRG